MLERLLVVGAVADGKRQRGDVVAWLVLVLLLVSGLGLGLGLGVGVGVGLLGLGLGPGAMLVPLKGRCSVSSSKSNTPKAHRSAGSRYGAE